MTQAPAPAPAAATAEAPVPAKKKLLSGKQIKIILIVVGVVVLPAIGAALLLPKGHAASTGEQSAEGGAAHAEESHSSKSENLVEVEVGSFSVSVEPDDAQMWNVSFKLFATVNSDAQSHFGDASEKYKARLRQAVVEVVRRSSIKDLRDPQLDLMKRELKSQLNNVMSEPYIQEVIVSEIRVMQQ